MILKYDEIHHETLKARYFRFGSKNVWIPRNDSRNLDRENKTIDVKRKIVWGNNLENYLA